MAFSNIFGKRKKHTRQTNRVRPQFEALETRLVLNGETPDPGDNGNPVDNDPGHDIPLDPNPTIVDVQRDGTTLEIDIESDEDMFVLIRELPANDYLVLVTDDSNPEPHHEHTYNSYVDPFDHIVVHLGDGNNTVMNHSNVSSEIFGGSGFDIIVGGNGVDQIWGDPDATSDDSGYTGLGNYLFGRGDSDIIHGTPATDLIVGDAYNDNRNFLNVSARFDWMDIPNSPAEFFQTTGNLLASNGPFDGGDQIFGYGGDDRIYGNGGDDMIEGHEGGDWIHGGSQNDTILGHAGDDYLHGGLDNDTIRGHADNDTLRGDAGDDTLEGGTGADALFAGSESEILRANSPYETSDGEIDRLIVWETNAGVPDAEDNETVPSTNTTATFDSEDVTIYFNDTHGGTVSSWGHVLSGGAWTSTQIEELDEIFQFIQNQRGDTSLLKAANGESFNFQRVGTGLKPDGSEYFAAGHYDHGTIRIFDAALTQYDDAVFDSIPTTGSAQWEANTRRYLNNVWFKQTAIHEMGHAFDEEKENPLISDFRALSGWENVPTFLGMPLSDVSGKVKSISHLNTWWHDEGVSFAREYSRRNPLEDWATTYAVYWMNEIAVQYPSLIWKNVSWPDGIAGGVPFYFDHGGGYRGTIDVTSVAASISDKTAFVDSFVPQSTSTISSPLQPSPHRVYVNLQYSTGADDGIVDKVTIEQHDGVLEFHYEISGQDVVAVHTEDASLVTRIVVTGSSDDDQVVIGEGVDIRVEFDGGEGNDSLTIQKGDGEDFVLVDEDEVLHIQSDERFEFDNIEHLQIDLGGGDSGTIIGQYPAVAELVVNGGDGNDEFMLLPDVLSGLFNFDPDDEPHGTVSFNGYGGTNTLHGTNHDSTWTMTDTEAGELNGFASFTGINVLVAGDGSDTLTGPGINNQWTITSADAGTLNSVEFSGIENLIGNAQDDTFAFAPVSETDASISGMIDGGTTGHDVLDYSADNRAAHVTMSSHTTLETDRVAGAVSNIDGVTGSSYSDTLVGTDAATAWSVAGRDRSVIHRPAPHGKFYIYDVENLVSGAGNDFFWIDARSNVAGSIDTGAGHDEVYLRSDVRGFTDTVIINGNSVQRNAWTNTINNAEKLQLELYDGASTTHINAFPDVNEFTIIGGNDDDVLNVNAVVPNGISASFDGLGGNDTLAGPDAASVNWRIASDNAGSVEDGEAGFTFDSFENLIGGDGNDLFYFVDSASVTGAIDGGEGADKLNYFADNRDITVTMHSGTDLSATGIGGGASNMESFWGSETGNDTLVGPDDSPLLSWLITSNNYGYVADWQEYQPFSFARVENLTGGASRDLFRFHYSGSIDGNIDGGGHLADELRYRKYDSGAHVDLMNGTATGVGGSVANVERVIGSVYDDFIRGDDNVNRLDGYHSGNDVILGMGGMDYIYGGTGNNILVGGEMHDYIRSRGEDILIAGSTEYDDHEHADAIFAAMRDVWTSGQDIAQRIATLRNGIDVTLPDETDPLAVALNSDTVSDETEYDQIHDLGGTDWYFASLAEALDFDDDDDWLN